MNADLQRAYAELGATHRRWLKWLAEVGAEVAERALVGTRFDGLDLAALAEADTPEKVRQFWDEFLNSY